MRKLNLLEHDYNPLYALFRTNYDKIVEYVYYSIKRDRIIILIDSPWHFKNSDLVVIGEL